MIVYNCPDKFDRDVTTGNQWFLLGKLRVEIFQAEYGEIGQEN